MITFDSIINLFTVVGFTNFLGLLLKILIFLYAVCAFIVVRQVLLMNRSFTTPAALVFVILAYVHFFAALGLAILSLVLL